MIYAENLPGFSGFIYSKSVAQTPVLNSLGKRTRYVNAPDYVMNQSFDYRTAADRAKTEEETTQAPGLVSTNRDQETNHISWFYEGVGESYIAKASAGINNGLAVFGEEANPQDELNWQITVAMTNIAKDVEYAFINSVGQKTTGKAVASKTNGLNNAITTYTKAVANEELSVWHVNEILTNMAKKGRMGQRMTLLCDATGINQIHASAKRAGFALAEGVKDEAGFEFSTIKLPQGTVVIKQGFELPAGTAFILNFAEIGAVEQPVPEKGNFFVDELAKTSAAETHQILGSMGIDYGAEFLHGKITGIATTFAADTALRVKDETPAA